MKKNNHLTCKVYSVQQSTARKQCTDCSGKENLIHTNPVVYYVYINSKIIYRNYAFRHN